LLAFDDTETLALIAAILYVLAPFGVIEVPLDGFSQSSFKGFLRTVDFNKVVRSIMQLSKLASAADQFVLTD
jgi:hypothetical protein